MFSSGDTFGLDGSWSVVLPKLTWKTKKPVAPGSSACVDGKYAPIGLFGEALIPKYGARLPLVHAVELNKVAVPERVPVSAKLAGLLSLLGTSTSMNKVPVAGPGETVKPKFEGGLVLVGEFVPLSTHCAAPAQ
jgi:hypothetical protein